MAQGLIGSSGDDVSRPLTGVPCIRCAGVLIEDRKILLVQQFYKNTGRWTLPGGTLELGETLEQGLVREMREETSLDVEVGDLLYVCDRFRRRGRHVVDMTFEVRRLGGSLRATNCEDLDEEEIAAAAMVPIDELTAYGFSQRFIDLARQGFPNRGSYQGLFHDFYEH